jgi:hypothetical protein
VSLLPLNEFTLMKAKAMPSRHRASVRKMRMSSVASRLLLLALHHRYADALVAPRAPAGASPFGDPLRLSGRKLHNPPYTSPAIFLRPAAALATGVCLPMLGSSSSASAAKPINMPIDLSTAALDPSTFQPVCPASDGVYRFGQTLIVSIVGPESYKEYAPLIAGGLLRVRLELCVLESFFYEAVVPFVKENGLSWVLPLHESVETFLAGIVFSIATNFILIGSTKIVTVIVTYADIFAGLPARTIGGVGWRALEDKALKISEAQAPEEKPRPWYAHCGIARTRAAEVVARRGCITRARCATATCRLDAPPRLATLTRHLDAPP